MNIGNWVKRPGKFSRKVDPDGTVRWVGPRWHLTESVIEDRAVTRCGREMPHVTKRGELEVSGVMPLTRMIDQPQLCHGGCAD